MTPARDPGGRGSRPRHVVLAEGTSEREAADRRVLGCDVSPARAADVPWLVELTARTVHTPWSTADLAAQLANPQALFRVARGVEDPAAAEPLGYLLAHRIADELHVLLLAVEPARRRRGIASALVAHALAEGRATGARVALLEVRAGNEAARALYAGFGFREVGRRRRYYADGEDAVLLTLELEAADGAPRGAR